MFAGSATTIDDRAPTAHWGDRRRRCPAPPDRHRPLRDRTRLGYAKIYEAAPGIVSKDTKYEPTHVADARRLAGEILAALSAAMTPKAREWWDLLQRAWTLVTKMYFEVQEAGTFLLRYDPRRVERFPSLYAAARGGGPKKGKKTAAGEGKTDGDGK
jgi:hypothetical protein